MILDTIWPSIVTLCKRHPEILIFLSLAIGYYVGKIKLFGFNLGSTASVLLAALALGQLDVPITPLIKSVAFALFIFTIGYKVGPQFFGGLKKEGISYLILAVFVAAVGLITAIILGKLFGFDKGTTAGLLGGAMTQSSIIGTAEGAIGTLSISSVQKSLLSSHLAIAYAITYIFGVAGLILFYKIIPRILKINLKEDAQQLEAKLSGTTSTKKSPDIFIWDTRPSMRVYRIDNKELEGKQVRDLQKTFTKKVTIEQIKRGNKLLEPKPNTVLHTQDLVAIIASREQILNAQNIIGPEVDDPTLVSLPIETLDVCIIKPQVVGKTIGSVASKYGKNCFIKKITRQGHDIPLKKRTILLKCDIVHVIGLQKDVESFVKNVGYPERKTKATDLITVGLGCFLGTLLGLAGVKLGAIPLTLGIGGGILLLGIIFGWLRSVHPTFGHIPDGAQWLLTNLGLNLFIACVGLTAGPRALHALQAQGLSLMLAGIILTLTPHILGTIFGRMVLKLDYILLFGALTGAGTATPSLNVLKNESDSSAPALGYTVPYALGNFILTIFGTVIVYLM